MSRRVNKERTRRRLLQGVIKVIHRQGAAALTTGRVAQLAGVAQPTFYVHFKGMDEALQQVSDWVAGELGHAFDPSPADARENVEQAIEQAVNTCARSLVRDRKIAEVFLRHRRDATSPMGLRWMALIENLRDRMEQLVLQFDPKRPATDACVHAELLVSAAIGLAEAFVDGRIEDLDLATSMATRSVLASIQAGRAVADAA
jgi:AcrR family transcriptional regulator